MINYYLKTVDEPALWEVLETAWIVTRSYSEFDEEGNPVGEFTRSWQGYDLDIVGTIYKPTGAVDEEGNPVIEALEGYHANLRRQDGAPIEAELPAVTPTNPVRLWSGDVGTE